VAESCGYPYFLQEYGRLLWREAECSPITLEEFRVTQPMIAAELDRRFFKDRFESASEVDFTVPQFADYIRRNHPLDSFSAG
jgi:hypothetical protein